MEIKSPGHLVTCYMATGHWWALSPNERKICLSYKFKSLNTQMWISVIARRYLHSICILTPTIGSEKISKMDKTNWRERISTKMGQCTQFRNNWDLKTLDPRHWVATSWETWFIHCYRGSLYPLSWTQENKELSAERELQGSMIFADGKVWSWVT